MILDEQERILRLEEGDEAIHRGHSVCGICGKDMPNVWDVVCLKCNGTFCYDHALAKNGHWYCLDCYVELNNGPR